MNIKIFDKLDSTNKYAKENLEKLKHFDVIITNCQDAGYGQWGRKWIYTGDQNIYLSIILKPESLSDVFTDIVRFTAICICKVFLDYDINPKIKDPNDIMVNNKKIAGILAESVTKGSSLKGIVIGVGINLNSDFNSLNLIDQSATSLNIETGKYIDKMLFTDNFLKIFEYFYPKFIQKEINLNLFL